MMLSLHITILFLVGLTTAQNFGAEETKTEFVPIKNEKITKVLPQPTYTLLKMPFDGQKVLDDVKAKVSNVVEKFSAKVPEELPGLKSVKEK